jgi:hypothetical protein
VDIARGIMPSLQFFPPSAAQTVSSPLFPYPFPFLKN